MKTPEFWHGRGGALPRLLSPLGGLYALAGRAERAWTKAESAPVPVICVGNLTAGGSGKTPIAIAIARLLTAVGRIPHFLTRGYGGCVAGPLRVDGANHAIAEVGDEALLLARAAPTWVCQDRRHGAQAAVEAGADCLILDDGYQDPRLRKDTALVIADGATGFGNGRVIPAGPLRESVAGGLARADALIVVAPDRQGVAALAARLRPDLPILDARLEPTEDARRLSHRKVFAFCGIGIPEKFRTTLKDIGVEIAGFRAFPDHHPYTARDLAALQADALEAGDVQLVTTAKDAVRLTPQERMGIEVVDIEAVFSDAAALARVLGVTLPSAAPEAPDRDGSGTS
ncbi:MAG: tetraacyldisaccharide 4'-kinase [Alphaproteobacteria bacterium]